MNASKTIFLLSSNRWNSAITEYVASSAKALKLLGYETVIVCRSDSAASKRLTSEHKNVIEVKSFNVFSFLKVRTKIKNSHSPIAISFGGPESTLLNFIGIKNLKRVRFRGQNFNPSFKWRFSHFLSHFKFSCLVTPSDWLAKKLEAQTKIPVQKIDLGVDESKYKWIKNTQRKKQITLVARFDPVKGHRFLFQVFSSLLKSWPNREDAPKLRLIGREENVTLPQLRKWAQEFEIDDRISIETNKIENIETELNQTDLAIIPSLGSEVICRSAFEFLLCGCPIFVSGVGSLGEAIRHPIFGTNYQQKPVSDTAEMLVAAYQDAQNEDEESRRIRSEQAKKYYSITAMAQHFKDLFHKHC